MLWLHYPTRKSCWVSKQCRILCIHVLRKQMKVEKLHVDCQTLYLGMPTADRATVACYSITIYVFKNVDSHWAMTKQRPWRRGSSDSHGARWVEPTSLSLSHLNNSPQLTSPESWSDMLVTRRSSALQPSGCPDGIRVRLFSSRESLLTHTACFLPCITAT
jgi:hypothetical protein